MYTLEEAIESNKYRLWYKRPLALEWGEWENFEAFLHRKYPVQFFFRSSVPRFLRRLRQKMKDYYYEIRCYFYPYNILRIRSLPRTWVDRDELLLHAAFQILIDYVEKEDTWILEDLDKAIEEEEKNEWNPGWHRHHKENHLKLRELYYCGKNTLPRLDDIKSEMSLKQEDELYEEISKKLTSLMELRGYLWT